MNYVDLFSLLNHKDRFAMLYLLSNRELCICELEQLLAAKQYQISRQMRILKDANLVKVRKEDKYHYYSLVLGDDQVANLLRYMQNRPDDFMKILQNKLRVLDENPIVCER